VNKKLTAALCGAATLTLALAGCGSSSSSKADNYAKTVCDQVQPQLQKIQNANNSIASVSSGNHSPDDVKNSDSAAFQQLSDAYKALADAVNNAGAPPVEGGAQIQQNAVKQLNDTSGAYANLKSTVDGLDTSDQSKFADGLKGVASQLSTLGKSGNDALNKLQSGDVGTAMAKQPGCQKPPASPTSSPSGSAPSPSGSPSGAKSAAAGAPSSPASPSASASKSSSPSPSASQSKKS
jgi:hypothetical protein